MIARYKNIYIFYLSGGKARGLSSFSFRRKEISLFETKEKGISKELLILKKFHVVLRDVVLKDVIVTLDISKVDLDAF